MGKSEQLAIPDYSTVVKRDITTDGQPCYVAYHPELPNCKGQGETPAEALDSLAEATEMVVEHLHAFGLPLPMPFDHLVIEVPASESAALQSKQMKRTGPYTSPTSFGSQWHYSSGR